MASKWEKAEREAKKHSTTFYCHFCAMKNVYSTLSRAPIAELHWKAWEYFECDFCDHIGIECQGPSMIAPLKQGRLKMHKRISIFLSNEDLMRVYDICSAERLSPTQAISKLVRAGFEALETAYMVLTSQKTRLEEHVDAVTLARAALAKARGEEGEKNT